MSSIGNVPGDGTLPPPVCAIDKIAKVFNVECQTAMVILNVIIGGLVILIVLGICFYIKLKYDRKVKKQRAYLRKLGITSERQIPVDLDDLEVPRENVEINRRLGNLTIGDLKHNHPATVAVLGNKIQSSKLYFPKLLKYKLFIIEHIF